VTYDEVMTSSDVIGKFSFLRVATWRCARSDGRQTMTLQKFLGPVLRCFNS
jgi:hypothetical protein